MVGLDDVVKLLPGPTHTDIKPKSVKGEWVVVINVKKRHVELWHAFIQEDRYAETVPFGFGNASLIN